MITAENFLQEYRKKFRFLLKEAGPCRSCELAEIVGCTTCEARQVLKEMEIAGEVERLNISPALTKFKLRDSASLQAADLLRLELHPEDDQQTSF